VAEPVTLSALQELLKDRLNPRRDRLWCRLPDRSWSKVTDDATLPWNRPGATGGPYTIAAQNDAPPPSPEKAKGVAQPDVLGGPSSLLDHGHAHALMQPSIWWPPLCAVVLPNLRPTW